MVDDLLLIACSKSKLNRRAAARNLYTGQLFKCAMRYADHTGRPVLILSLKHGWLNPDDAIDPYDFTIPYSQSYEGEWPEGAGHYIGGQHYFRKAPERFQPLVPYYHNRGTLSWQAHMNNMMAGVGCLHGFTRKMKYPCPVCYAG